MQYLLLHYGYAFLILGLIVEGDATLVAAAILAGQNYFDLRWLIGLAIGVTTVLNEALYEVGIRGRLRNRLTPRQQARAERWLHSRFGLGPLLFSRFMWGFRLVIPVAAGLLHIRRRRFFWTNIIGGCFWSLVLIYFGVALQAMAMGLWRTVTRYQSDVAVGIFLVGMGFAIGSIPLQITLRRRRQSEELTTLVLTPGESKNARKP